MKKTTAILALALLAAAAGAAKVGVVIGYPNGTTHYECLLLNGGEDGYETLEETALSMTWSEAGIWGHGLCGINGVGCPPDNCYCGGSNYWGFFLSENGENNWNYMPVGFDAPDECWDRDYNSYAGHYCTRDGDIIGLAYGPWGTQPDYKKFAEICGLEKTKKRAEKKLDIKTEVENNGKPAAERIEAEAESEIKIEIRDTETGDGLKNIEVVVYEGVPGASKKIFADTTDDEGVVSFQMSEPGEYRMRISGPNYPHEYLTLKILQKKEETTSTAETTTAPTTIEETTTSVIEETATIVEATTTAELIPPKREVLATTTLEQKSLKNILGFAITQKGGTKKAGWLVLALTAVALAGLYLKNSSKI